MFAIPADAPIRQSSAYQEGKVHGIDAASVVACIALNPQPGESVLELCCAPGGKFCMLADLMEHHGNLVGVDLSPHRMSICRKMVLKYGVGVPVGEPLLFAWIADYSATFTPFRTQANRTGMFDSSVPTVPLSKWVRAIKYLKQELTKLSMTLTTTTEESLRPVVPQSQ